MKEKLLFAVFIIGLNAHAQVGIGTSDPKASLDVVNTDSGVLIPRVTTSERIGMTAGTDQNGMLVYDTDIKSFWYYDSISASWLPFTADPNAGKFLDGTIDATKAIYTSGNVGIGVSDPQYKLHVIGDRIEISNNAARTGNLYNGTSSDNGVAFSADGYIEAQRASGSVMHLSKPTGAADGILADFYYGGSHIGTITTDGSSTTYGTTSDRRLKESIAPLKKGEGMELLSKIIPVSYYWKNNIEKKNADIGFIAQDLYQIFPQAVVKGDDNDISKLYMIDYSKLVPVLVQAFHDQQAEIELQNNEVEKLRKEIEEIKVLFQKRK